MPSNRCRDCGLKERQKPYWRCVDCLPKTHRGTCLDCGADVVRRSGATGPLPRRCDPCRQRRRYAQSKASQQRALEDPERMEKERERRRRQMANWRKANPEHRRRLDREAKARAYADPERRARMRRNGKVGRISRKYGVSRAEAEALVDRAGEGCAICGGDGGGRPLGLDHCHTTGRVRDWLCAKCNSGLGQFDDDSARMRAAAAYIESHRP